MTTHDQERQFLNGLLGMAEPLCGTSLKDGEKVGFWQYVPEGWITNGVWNIRGASYGQSYEITSNSVIETDGSSRDNNHMWKYLSSYRFIAGNKYLFTVRINSSISRKLMLGCGTSNYPNYGGNVQTTGVIAGLSQVGEVVKVTGSNAMSLFASDVNTTSSGQTYEIFNYQLFDLTAMFGAGNEPSTPDAFANLFGYETIDDMPYFSPDLNGTYVAFNGKLYKVTE